MRRLKFVVERTAMRLVRLPLVMAVAIAVLLVLDGLGIPGAFATARIGVRLMLATYLLAGVLNLPFFPRALRRYGAARATDRLLLDLWSVVALIVGAAMALDGTAALLF